VVNAQGQVLITRRPEHVHQGGLWEFPGGKMEPGETIRMALNRELLEELGIEILAARPLIRIPHAYPDKTVLLDVWRIDRYRGEPHGREGQPLEWLSPQRLSSRAFPAANRPIINALRLPPTYLITGEPADQPEAFLDHLEQALRRGIGMVQLRARQLPEDPLISLYLRAHHLCRQYQVPLLLNGSPEQARSIDADGIHLTTRRLLALDHRPLIAQRWVAASCHSLAEVRHACRIGVDFIVVSPVRVTASHPEACPIGWEGLREFTESATVPVYALGGITPADLEQAWANGAQGIAAIRALWGDLDRLTM
jgi:8-oxo-dGTP diphosphatase